MKKLLYIFLLGAAVILNAAPVEIIKNGRSKLVVVVEDETNPVLKMAGRELAEHLAKRTGITIPVINNSAKLPAGAYPFYLGFSDRTKKLGADEKKLKFDGYFLKVTDKYALIAGRDKPNTRDPYYGHHFVYGNKKLGIYEFGEKGTLNGVYRFLNKFAGVRHYMPGEIGTIIPKSKDFIVEAQEFYDAPAFRERMFGAVWFEQASSDWLHWHHRLYAGGERCHINHSYNYMRRYQKTNPEFFALIGGKRDFTNLSTANHYGNLCMTNKEGIKAFAKIASDFFDRNPDFAVFPIVPQDGLYKVCECPDCKKLYSPHLGEEGKFSNLVFHHASEVAKILKKTHPDKFIGVLAYESYRNAPDITLPDNLYVCICYRRQDMRDPVKKKNIEKTFKDYVKKNAKLHVWTYALYNHIPPMRGIPLLYSKILKENINFNLKHNVVGEKAEGWYYSGGGDQYIKGRVSGLHASTHLHDYVRCQLLWDPSLDTVALLDEYYRLFYGPAQKEMKKFWQTAEDLFMKRGEATVYTVEDLKLFDSLLDAAIKKAPANTVYGKRIRMLKNELAPFFKTMYQIKSSSRTASAQFVNQEIPMTYSKNNVWKYARSFRFTTKNGNSVVPHHATTMYLLANKKGLAIYLEAKEDNTAKLVKNSKVRDAAPTWKDDCYELFIVTKDRAVNLHYLITAGGNIMDGKRTVDVNVADWAWNSKLSLKQTQTAKQWNTMIFIPWTDLGFTCDKLPPILFQVFRRQTSGSLTNGNYQVLFPSAGFHNYSPEYFGDLNLIPAKDQLQNGSFESIAQDGFPVGWSKRGKLVNDAADGKKALYLCAEGKKLIDSGSTFIPVQAETDYMFHLMHKGGGAFCYVLFFDAKNKVVPEPGVNFYYTGVQKNWKLKTFQGKVPKRAVKAKIILRSFQKKAADGAYFDDVKFFSGNIIK